MPNTRFTLAQPTPSTQAFLITGTQYLVMKLNFYCISVYPNPSQKRDPDRSRSSLAILENHGVILKLGLHMPQ